MILPDLETEIDEAIVFDRQIVAAAHAAVLENNALVFHFGQVLEFEGFELTDQDLGLLNPVIIDFVPILIVVAGPFHKQRNTGFNLLGIGNTDRGNINVAVDNTVINTLGRRHHKNPGIVLGKGQIPGFVPNQVKRTMGFRIVEAVVIPQLPAFIFVALLIISRKLVVVRIHPLPTLGPFNFWHLMRIQKLLGHNLPPPCGKCYVFIPAMDHYQPNRKFTG